MPKSRSVWPSVLPRNLTRERSGSFRLASPPASWASEDAAVLSESKAAAAPNLVMLQHRDQAFASQVSIHNPPQIIRSQGNGFPGEPLPAHFFGRALIGASHKR